MEDEGKQEKFEFTAEGESFGYISLDQARILAMRTAREAPGAYGRRFRNVLMAFEVAAEEETEDHYVVTLSFRPQGAFAGSPGQEQFFIGKEGVLEHRQVLDVPTAVGRRFPVIPVAVGLVVVVVVAAVGVVVAGGLGGGGNETGPVSTLIPTATPPTATPPPTSQSALRRIQAQSQASQLALVSHSFPDSGGDLSEGQYEVTVDVQLPGIEEAELWLMVLDVECTGSIVSIGDARVDQASLTPGNSSHSLTWTVTESDLQKLRREGAVCVEVVVVEPFVPGSGGRTQLAHIQIGTFAVDPGASTTTSIPNPNLESDTRIVIVSHSFPEDGGYLSEGQYEVIVDVQLLGIGEAELWLQALDVECTRGIGFGDGSRVDHASLTPGSSSHSLAWTFTAIDLQRLRREEDVCVQVSVLEREVPGIVGQTQLAHFQIGTFSADPGASTTTSIPNPNLESDTRIVIVSHSFPEGGGYLSEGQYEVIVDVQLPGIGEAELWLQAQDVECNSGISVDRASVIPGNSSHSLTWIVTASDLQRLRREGDVCVQVSVLEREVPGIVGQIVLAQSEIGTFAARP